jgi:hypothetical protein
MKRALTSIAEDAGGSGAGVPSLQNLLLSRIVGSFDSQDALDYYVAIIGRPEIRELVRERWRLKNASPAHSLVCVKRRLVSADITIRYLDTRELINHGGTISQTTRTHTTPIAVDTEAGASFTEVMLGKLQLDLQRSTTHRTLRFLLY